MKFAPCTKAALQQYVGNDRIKPTTLSPFNFWPGSELHTVPVISPVLRPDLSIPLLICDR